MRIPARPHRSREREREDAPRVVLVRDVTERDAREHTLRDRTAVLDAHSEATSDGSSSWTRTSAS